MPLFWLSNDDARVRLRSEQVLSTARIVLAAGGLVATYLDPTEPASHAELVYSLLAVYVVVSSAIAFLIHRQAAVSMQTARALVVLDLTYAAVLTLFTSGASSPLFVFCWFFLLSGAFRYGFGGAIAAALLLIGVMFLQIALRPYLIDPEPFEWNFVIVRSSYLAVMAFLLGYLTQKEQDLRGEAVIVARTLANTRDIRSFAEAIRHAATELRNLFGIRRGVLAFQSAEGNRQCWYWAQDDRGVATTRSLAFDERQSVYFFPVAEDLHVWASEKMVAAGQAMDFAGNRVAAPTAPAELWQSVDSRHLVGLCAPLSDGSAARLYLLHSGPAWDITQLHLLHVIALTVGPALHNLLLLEIEAGASERGRIARELHDRVIQSLIGVELQLAALQRLGTDPERLLSGLRTVHDTVRGEVLNVRDLMHELRPLEVPPRELPTHLGSVLERFERDTGIQAVFRPNGVEFPLSAKRCGDLVRLVQEALMNVRKHSGATHVRVELTPEGEGVVLSIADDGRGFQFEGRLEDQELWSQHTGPRVIQERARAIGGSLAIESQPGLGARLELFIPYAI